MGYAILLWHYLSRPYNYLDFLKKKFRNTIRMSNSLDPDQAQSVCQVYQQTTLVDKEKMKSWFTELFI